MYKIISIIILIILFYFNYNLELFQACTQPVENGNKDVFFKNPFCVSFCLNKYIEKESPDIGTDTSFKYNINDCRLRPEKYVIDPDPAQGTKKDLLNRAPYKYDLGTDGGGIIKRWKFKDPPAGESKEQWKAQFVSDGCAACIMNFYQSLKAIRCSKICTDDDCSYLQDDPCYDCDCNDSCEVETNNRIDGLTLEFPTYDEISASASCK